MKTNDFFLVGDAQQDTWVNDLDNDKGNYNIFIYCPKYSYVNAIGNINWNFNKNEVTVSIFSIDIELKSIFFENKVKMDEIIDFSKEILNKVHRSEPIFIELKKGFRYKAIIEENCMKSKLCGFESYVDDLLFDKRINMI